LDIYAKDSGVAVSMRKQSLT